jgi:hypothetical protein
MMDIYDIGEEKHPEFNYFIILFIAVVIAAVSTIVLCAN